MSMAFNSQLGPMGSASEADLINNEIYYLRAFYATVFLTIPSNHLFLSRHNSSFVNSLFDQIYTSLRPAKQFTIEGSDLIDEGITLNIC